MKESFYANVAFWSGESWTSPAYDYENEMYADLEVLGYTEDNPTIETVDYYRVSGHKSENIY